jgi:methylated-DNA-[protein]-cysteine S-methyltransferase
MSAKHPLSPDILQRIKEYPLFYQKVWLACARIPSGKVMTYKQLAAAIGHPGAARAVGTALSKNPFAPVVPCHRVISSDGSMGGYSGPGGVKRKRQLLEQEKWRGD